MNTSCKGRWRAIPDKVEQRLCKNEQTYSYATLEFRSFRDVSEILDQQLSDRSETDRFHNGDTGSAIIPPAFFAGAHCETRSKASDCGAKTDGSD